MDGPSAFLLPFILTSFIANNVMIYAARPAQSCPPCPVIPISNNLCPGSSLTTSNSGRSTTKSKSNTKCPRLTADPPPPFPPLDCPPKADGKPDRFCYIKTENPSIRFTIPQYHNVERRRERAADMKKMVWSQEAANKAQAQADGCSKIKEPTETNAACNQNIYVSKTILTWGIVISKWAKEKKNFKFGEPSPGTEAYTQIVWASTDQVGCGVKECSGEIYYVCYYCPAGNIKGRETQPYTPGEDCATCECNCEDSLCTEPD